MKTLIAVFMLFVSFEALSQSSKSAEVPDNSILSEDERMKLEQREEQRVRQEWDREEQEARTTEEKRRFQDEERAENDDVLIIVPPVNQRRR